MTISVKKIKKLLLGALSLGAALVLFAAPAPALATCGPVALDPGHGGTEVGAHNNGLKEKELNWQVTLYCKERLDQLGIPNYVVKEKWEKLDRRERWLRAKAKNARVLISFHMNSADGIPSANGSEVLCCNFSTWNQFTNRESRAFGSDLLKRFQEMGFYNRGNKFNTGTGTYPDGSAADSMGINYYPRWDGTTGLIIEHGFLSNEFEAKRLGDPATLKQMGYADAEAIAKQWPNSYVKPAVSVRPSRAHWAQDSRGWKYILSDGSAATNCWQKISNRWYRFGADGYMLSGEITLGGAHYLLGGPSDGAMVTGWVWRNGAWYYYGGPDDGAMKTNWAYDGGWYYLGNDGRMRTGWVQVDSVCYWLNGSGRMATGWLSLGSTWYWLDLNSGAMAENGTAVCHGVRSLFNGSGAWISGSGWRQLGNRWFYLSGDRVATGWLNLGGAWYWLAGDGAMATGWTWVGNAWYYLGGQGDGAMKTGWILVDNKWYYCNASGAMLTGWQWVGNAWYLLGSDGAMLTGWQRIDNKTYYLNGSGAMLTGKQAIDGKNYEFDSSGALLNDPNQRVGWFKEPNGQWRYYDSKGNMLTGWQTINGARYYLGTDGIMVTGRQTIGGAAYVFDNDGKAINGWYNVSLQPSNSSVSGSKVHYYEGGKETYTRPGNTPVMGASAMGKDAFVKAFAAKIQANYPQIYRDDAKYGAQTPEAFAQATWDAAEKEGVRPEVLAAQVGNETGWLKFGGIVNANQCNFGGLGALDGNANGNAATFANVQEGLLAQAQHLKAYSSKEALAQPCVDPRFHLIANRGIAPYLEDYGADGHGGLVWASNRLYGRDLLAAMKAITG